MARERAKRPTHCKICQKALPRASRGRVRETCSARCRQRKRRSDYWGWIEPRQNQKEWRRAEREVRRIEKRVGSLDTPLPDYPYLTLKKRIQIRLHRGERVPFCRVCWRPYVWDTWHSTLTCGRKCADIYRERQAALEAGLEKFAGKYDPRVDVRIRLGLPIKTCRHCGIPFPDYHPRQVYCGKACRDAAWYALHPKRRCKECGRVYRGTRKTCSMACYKRRWRRVGTFCDRCHHAIPEGREMRYEPSYNGPDPEPIRSHGKLIAFQEAVFCSARCRDALGWSPSRKVCEECREGYYPKNKTWQNRGQRFCSKTCAGRFYYRLRKERRSAERGGAASS